MVGLAKGRETEDPVPGDAPEAHWRLDVSVGVDERGAFDFGGPYVAGHRDERCLYLRWLRRDVEGNDVLFRAAKLRLYEIDRELVQAALEPGSALVGRIGLTDSDVPFLGGHQIAESAQSSDRFSASDVLDNLA